MLSYSLLSLTRVAFASISLANVSMSTFGLCTQNVMLFSKEVFGGLTLLITLITNYLWQFRPFKWLFWVDDFSGRYEGKLVYQYKDDNGNIIDGTKVWTDS